MGSLKRSWKMCRRRRGQEGGGGKEGRRVGGGREGGREENQCSLVNQTQPFTTGAFYFCC